MTTCVVESDSVEATQAIGRRIGAALRPGHILALVGPLGSGKTTLVRGIAEGACVRDTRQVNSPTFVLINEYDAGSEDSPLHIYHVDAYRLRGGDDLDALGFEEMPARGAVLIEWADRVEDLLPHGTLHLRIEPVSENGRRFHFGGDGPSVDELKSVLS